jgi:hypothetical protein
VEFARKRKIIVKKADRRIMSRDILFDKQKIMLYDREANELRIFRRSISFYE